MTAFLEERLSSRKKAGNLRTLQPSHYNLIDFASNDYLGLAKSMGTTTGGGATGSRLLTGNSQLAFEIEELLARFHGYEAALLCNCGYMANLALMMTVAGEQDAIFFDVAVHASIRDGIRLSRAQAFAFRHNDCMHLEKRLKNSSSKGTCFICVESIYSTDGSIAPLEAICEVAARYGAHVIVDEAHATGVWGPQGRGLVAHLGLTKAVFAHVVTFGKALGTFGACILSSAFVKEGLINFATPFIYTTALPLCVLHAIRASYERFPYMEKERNHIYQLIAVFSSLCERASRTQVQFIRCPGNRALREAALKMRACGFDVSPLMSPTVARGEERLRICLHAFNTREELTILCRELL